MNVKDQIKKFIGELPEPIDNDIQELHNIILKVLPKCKLWFMDGKNSENRQIANPTIGYGLQTIKYTNGATREFFQIGIGPNKTGIFVHILPIKDKAYFAKTYGKKLGKATVSGYSVKFKSLKEINIDVLKEAIKVYGAKQ